MPEDPLVTNRNKAIDEQIAYQYHLNIACVIIIIISALSLVLTILIRPSFWSLLILIPVVGGVSAFTFVATKLMNLLKVTDENSTYSYFDEEKQISASHIILIYSTPLLLMGYFFTHSNFVNLSFVFYTSPIKNPSFNGFLCFGPSPKIDKYIYIVPLSPVGFCCHGITGEVGSVETTS